MHWMESLRVGDLASWLDGDNDFALNVDVANVLDGVLSSGLQRRSL